MTFIKVNPIIEPSVIKLCKKPYYNHKNGCPNWNKKCGCPPRCKLISKDVDLTKDVYAIYNKFNLKEHVKKMKEKHPDWSEHQLKCVLYWQPKARKKLKEEVLKFKEKFPQYLIVWTPEGQGVNITETMNNAGIELEWPPKNFAYQIALAGISISS